LGYPGLDPWVTQHNFAETPNIVGLRCANPTYRQLVVQWKTST
jgi:hypothetical protein